MFDEDRIEEFLELTSHDRNYRVYLQMLYEQNDWESDDRSRELIFTMDEAKQSVQNTDGRLTVSQDVPKVANMLLLNQKEAEELKALGAIEWLQTRTADQRSFHFLPVPSTIDSSGFTTLFDARQDLIRTRLRNLFATALERKITSQKEQSDLIGEQHTTVST